MNRRFVLALAVGGLCAIAAASVPWTVPTERASRFVAAEMERSYGLIFSADGTTSLSLLPAPRLAFGNVTVRGSNGAAIVEAASLTADIGVAALLKGSADLAGLTLSGGRIIASRGGPASWDAPLARVAAGFDRSDARPPHLRRLSIRQSTLVRRDPGTGTDSETEIVDLTASWPRWSAKMEVSGMLRVADQPVSVRLSHLRPVDLATGNASPVRVAVEWPSGRLETEGSAILGDEPAWTGRLRLRTDAMHDSLALLGLPIAFAPLVSAFSAESTFVARDGRLLLPSLRAKLGADTLEGAAAIAVIGGRTAVSGTLAAETIDLSRIIAPLGKVVAPETAWGTQPLRLASSTASDLDLRLSAGTAIVGPVRFEDVASSILVKDGRIEASLARATVQGGTVKGRVAVTKGWQGTEFKAQGSVERMDLGGLLVELGQYRWVVGGAQGQIALESAGASPADLVRGLRGRASVSIDAGELSGVNLRDVMQKPVTQNGRPIVEGPSGRTPFDHVQVGMTFVDGVGEITEGGLQAASLVGALRGQVSMPARTVSARALIEQRDAARGSDPMAFEIVGPWDKVAVNLQKLPVSPGLPLGIRAPDAVRKDVLPSAASAFAQ